MSAQRELPLGPEPRRAPKPPAQRHSPTSVEAGKKVASRASNLRDQVLAFLRREGPATDEQMQDRIPMAGNTQRPRRRELVRLGLVEDSGQTAPTRSDGSAVLWRVVPGK